MDKTINYTHKFILFHTLSLSLSLLLVTACNNGATYTPDKFKYYNHNFSSNEYASDSILISNLLNRALKENAGPFAAKQVYDKKATIYLDTILYSPDKTGFATFIITKINKKNTERHDNDTAQCFFNASYLLGLKDSLQTPVRLFNYSSVIFVNFPNYKAAQFALYEYCFKRRATDRPYSANEPSYNLDDIRFWNGKQFNAIRSDTQYLHLHE